MIIQKVDHERADNFLVNNFSSPTHWSDWNLIVSRYYHTNFFYLGAFENNELIGIYPVHETKTKSGYLNNWYSGQYKNIPNGGWIFCKKNKIGLDQLPSRWKLMHRTFTLPEIPDFNVEYVNHKNNSGATLIIDLTEEIDNIWKNSLHSKRRNMVRKASKSDIITREAKTNDDLNEFYKIYKETSQRNGLNIMPYEIFLELFNATPNIKLTILMAFKQNIQIANVAVISDKNYSLYWLGNSGENVKNEGQGELLQWQIINLMKQSGCKYYDLCHISPKKLPNIYLFKKGFSDKEYPVRIFIKKPFYYKALRKITND